MTTSREVHKIEKVIENEAAETYDSIYTRLSFYEYRTELFARYIASLTNKIEFPKVLEIGCGTGNLTRRLGALVKEKGFIVGLDLSRKMIDIAKEKTKIASFVNALGEKLPFVDDSFDLVVGMGILHHLPDLDTFFEEVSRIVKRKGRIVFSEPYKGGILEIVLFRKAIKFLLLPLIVLLHRLNKERIENLPKQKFSPAHRHLRKEEIAKSLLGWQLYFTHTDVIISLFEGVTFDTNFDWKVCKIINMLDRILRTFIRGGGIIVKGVRI